MSPKIYVELISVFFSTFALICLVCWQSQIINQWHWLCVFKTVDRSAYYDLYTIAPNYIYYSKVIDITVYIQRSKIKWALAHLKVKFVRIQRASIFGIQSWQGLFIHKSRKHRKRSHVSPSECIDWSETISLSATSTYYRSTHCMYHITEHELRTCTANSLQGLSF